MAVIVVPEEGSFIPKTANQLITVFVEIGNGQSGSYSIFLGKDLLGQNSSALLGKKKDLQGKSTVISATIVDELEETNWTSIKVTVTEGNSPTVYGPYSKEADTHHDTIVYVLKLVHN